MELDWKVVNMTLNGNKINLPNVVTIKFQDKFKIRCIIKREPLLFHVMLKQGFTWFTLASNNSPEIVKDIPDIHPEMACDLAPQCNVLYRFFQCQLPEDTIDITMT